VMSRMFRCTFSAYVSLHFLGAEKYATESQG